MKQRLTPILLALFIAGTAVISGCGGSGNTVPQPGGQARNYAMEGADYAMPEAAAPSMAAAEAFPSSFTEEGESANLSDRKIIKTVSLSLETQEFDAAVAEIAALVERMGGYIEYSDVSGHSLNNRGSYSARSANFTARVPVERLNSAANELGELCNVRNRSENVSDITESYYDVDGRLKSLRVQEERLLSMLEQADKLEDMITIESALSEVRYQIESLTGQLNRMDSQVSYSTLNIDLSEVVEYSELRTEPKTFTERMGEAFSDSLYFIRIFGQNLIIFLIGALPFILVYGGMVLVIVLIVRALIRAGRKRRGLPPKGPSAPPPMPGLPPSPHPYQPSQPASPAPPRDEQKDEPRQ